MILWHTGAVLATEKKQKRIWGSSKLWGRWGSKIHGFVSILVLSTHIVVIRVVSYLFHQYQLTKHYFVYSQPLFSTFPANREFSCRHPIMKGTFNNSSIEWPQWYTIKCYYNFSKLKYFSTRVKISSCVERHSHGTTSSNNIGRNIQHWVLLENVDGVHWGGGGHDTFICFKETVVHWVEYSPLVKCFIVCTGTYFMLFEKWSTHNSP